MNRECYGCPGVALDGMQVCESCLAAQQKDALAQVQKIINELETLLSAARDAKEGIEKRDAKKIAEAMNTLDDHTEGHWHRLSVGDGTDEIHQMEEYLTADDDDDEPAEDERAEDAHLEMEYEARTDPDCFL